MNNHLITAIVLGIIGLIAGSFAGASVWRLRSRQLRLEAKHGEKPSEAEKKQVAKLLKRKVHNDRSVCLHCGHILAWYDLIPLVSWIAVKGRCRYCHKSIGWFEPVIELSMAAFFVLSYICWPVELQGWFAITQFVIWLVAGAGLAILTVYDMRWYLLPNVIVFPLIALGALNAFLVLVHAQFSVESIISVIAACMILSGLYYLIYFFSQHQWVGFGDVKLALALALLLANWELALLALFLANLIGTIIFLPFLVSGKIKSQTHIPFGPMLIAGWAIAGLFGARIIEWYLAISFHI